ncbi:MAG: glycosyltransferase family 39 protein [Rhodospirillales bacterium]|nr:glycosyltransferase family 39 protein [Rhodospirillales bacterium]
MIVGYFLIQALLRILVGPTLTQDEAQQTLFAQELRLGYDEHPGLYTWVVHLLFRVFGTSLAVLAGVKAAQLIALFLFTYRAVGRVAGPLAGAIASASLFLVPQIGWEMQRDLTHTLLSAASIPATLYFLIGIAQNGRWTGYLGFSLSLAVGALAKPHTPMVGIALLLAMVSVAALRPRLRPGRLLFAILLTLLLIAPSYLWLLGNPEIALKDIDKFGMGRAAAGSIESLWLGFFAVGQGLVSTLAIAFGAWAVATKGFTVESSGLPLERAFLLASLIAIAGTTLAVLAMGITELRIRYLLPTIFLPLLWAPLAYAPMLTAWRQGWPHLILGLGGALLIMAFLIAGHRYAPAFDLTNRLQTPFVPFLEAVERSGCQADLILAGEEFQAGNLRMLRPDLPVGAPSFQPRLASQASRGRPDSLLAVWRSRDRAAWQRVLSMAEAMGLRLGPSEARTVVLPVLNAPKDNPDSVGFSYRCIALLP